MHDPFTHCLLCFKLCFNAWMITVKAFSISIVLHHRYKNLSDTREKTISGRWNRIKDTPTARARIANLATRVDSHRKVFVIVQKHTQKSHRPTHFPDCSGREDYWRKTLGSTSAGKLTTLIKWINFKYINWWHSNPLSDFSWL